MDELDNKSTDILLPSASVSIFSMDDGTLKSAQALESDWRFARVSTNIVSGDVETAIETFEGKGSSDIVIIQTDEIDDNFTDRLGALSDHCDDDTAAIIIGPVNDVYLYRKLIDMGVSDYLVRPISTDIITDVISKALISRLGISDSRLIAFVGAKGGVGTSVISQICASIVSKKLGQKIVLIDASGGLSSLSVGMGFDPATTLSEISKAVEVGNEDSLERMFIDTDDNLTVSVSGSDAILDIPVSADQYEAIVENLMVKYPIVMVDLSCADPSVKKSVLARAHKINLITTPAVTSLRFSRSLLKEIAAVRGGDNDDVSLIVNKVGISKAHEVSSGDIEDALEVKPSAYVDYNPALFMKHESEIKSFISDKDASPVVTEFLAILQKHIPSNNQDLKDNGKDKSGVISSFLSKLTSK